MSFGPGQPGAGEPLPGTSRWPIAFVVVALLALALVPLAIDRREAEIEREITEVLDPARALAQDLALVHSRQIARFQSYLLSGDRRSFDRYNEARASEQRLYDQLVELADRMELDVRNRVAALYAASSAWHVMHAPALGTEGARLAYRADLTEDQRRSEDLLDASNALTEVIFQRLEDAQLRMDEERGLELRLTIGLVAVALLATLLVAGIGRGLRAAVAEASAQRESAERARREVDALMAATDDGVVGLDLHGICTFLNPAGAQLLGLTERDAVGRNVHDVLHGGVPEAHPLAACPIVTAIPAGATVREPEDVLRDADGEPVAVQWTLQPLIRGAAVRGAVLTFTDMSEIRRAQEELRQAVRARDEVVAVVSHDLRNPLGAIMGAASLVLDLEMTDEQRAENLRLICRAAERMNRLIGDLLDVARIESGGLSVHLGPVEVTPLVEEAVELLAPLARERGLKLDYTIDPAVGAVIADRDRMIQVFSNLVGNAVKFSRQGAIALAVAPAGDGWVRFSVSDTGPGIPPEAIDHVFDRFWRQDQTDRQGAGLGLAIVRGIVHAHGGDVRVESRAGEGATFSFTLRAARPEPSRRREIVPATSEPRPSP